jgi:DNA-directed RNA polymerase beta' subunit
MEFNLHFPTTLEAKSELKSLFNVKHNLINHSSRPNIAPTQDSIISPYLATRGWIVFSKEDFFDVCMFYKEKEKEKGKDGKKNNLFSRLEEIKSVYEEKFNNPNLLYTGRGLISLLLPNDFHYKKKNKAHPKEETLEIYKGCIISGTIDKSVIGGKTNSIIHFLHNEYSKDVCIEFMNSIQVFSVKILNILGFSITLADLKPKNKDRILEAIEKANRIKF